MSHQYVTTAIDYPNAAPHMGHVLEKVLADVVARWFRLRGDTVRFQIGTDEHGIKIQRTAEKEGITPKELVDSNVPLFRDLYEKLSISHDEFLRTSDQKKHWPTVIELWNRLKDAGMLEKKSYTGLYCSGCEHFLTKRDLVDGLCPNHKKAPEEVKEENWFFLLSKDTENLKKLLTGKWDNEKYRIIPEFRAQETLSLIDRNLDDVSFSRAKSSLAWGIPVPDDSDQTMYVWCDALTNYISGLGFFTDHEEREWWDKPDSDGEMPQVTHVIGKDISRFHALYWPAMLKHAGVRIPDRLLIHGFLTSDGEKMGKSLGNVVVPDDVIRKYGVDPLRFYLSHEIPVGRDGDFSWDRFGKLYDSKLRNDLGNLLNRVLVALKREEGTLSLDLESDSVNPKNVRGLVETNWNHFSERMDLLKVDSGIHEAMNILDHSNKLITDAGPWTKPLKEKIDILTGFAEGLRHVALMLLPFIPETAQKISRQLGVPYADQMLDKDFIIGDKKQWGSQKEWKNIGEPEILFPPVE